MNQFHRVNPLCEPFHCVNDWQVICSDGTLATYTGACTCGLGFWGISGRIQEAAADPAIVPIVSDMEVWGMSGVNRVHSRGSC